MFSHVFLGTNNLERAKVFYDALFAAVGGAPGHLDPVKGRLVYMHKGAILGITKPINGEEAGIANGGTIGFAMDSAEQIDKWHAAGASHGGTPCEDPPGIRPAFNAYLGYLRDPDGHKLCAMHVLPK